MSTTTFTEKEVNDLKDLVKESNKTLDGFDVVVRLGVLLPLTIVASNHLGNFLPLPVTCPSVMKSEWALWVSHTILFFLVYITISNNIKWEEFLNKESVAAWQRILLDLVVTFIGWFFILLFLRLRRLWMYAVLFGLIVAMVMSLNVYKNTELKNDADSKKAFITASVFVSLFLIVLLIFFVVSYLDYMRTKKDIKIAHRVDSGETYIVEYKKPTSDFWNYILNPEESSQAVCIDAKTTTKPFSLEKYKKQASKFGARMSQEELIKLMNINTVKEDISNKMKIIQNLPEDMQTHYLTLQSLGISKGTATVSKEQSLADLWKCGETNTNV